MTKKHKIMKKKIVLLFTVIISSLFAVHPALAQEQNIKDVSQKIEKLTEGLVGRIGVAAQEIGGDVVIAVNGDETLRHGQHLQGGDRHSCAGSCRQRGTQSRPTG